MSDELKVWVAVDGEGAAFTGAVAPNPEGCWHRLFKSIGQTKEWRQEHGWTVEPYTLTKGHKT